MSEEKKTVLKSIPIDSKCNVEITGELYHSFKNALVTNINSYEDKEALDLFLNDPELKSKDYKQSNIHLLMYTLKLFEDSFSAQKVSIEKEYTDSEILEMFNPSQDGV
jgi:hypothetical protein